jgi:putative ABC transport system permease protein
MKLIPLALRNVLRQRRRAILLGTAVGIGFLVIVFMDSLTAGMTASLKKNMTASFVGELYVSGSEWRERGGSVKRIADESILRAAIADSGLKVKTITPKSGGDATFIFGGKSAKASLTGIPWEGTSSALGSPAMASGNLQGMKEANGIVLPSSLAERLGVRSGESVLVKAATASGQMNVTEFVVSGVTKSLGGGDLLQSAYARIEAVNELLNIDRGACQQINLYLAKETDLESAASRLSAALTAKGALVEARKSNSNGMDGMPSMDGGDGSPGAFFGGVKTVASWTGTKYSIATLDDFAGQFNSILTTIESIAFVVFLALLAICMAGILNTFRMVLIERTREIGTMRAIGMRSREIRKLFIIEAVFMTLGGVIGGLVVSLTLMQAASLVSFGNGAIGMFLSGGRFAFKISVGNIAFYMMLIVGMGAVAVLSPASKAARLRPADALRS